MDKLRLFWAVNLPREIKETLFLAGKRLREADADAKWVEENNLHLTVKFLGDADQVMVERITQSAAHRLKDFGKFSLELKGAGFFPGARSPRVFWAGLGGNVAALAELAMTVEKAMEELIRKENEEREQLKQHEKPLFDESILEAEPEPKKEEKPKLTEATLFRDPSEVEAEAEAEAAAEPAEANDAAPVPPADTPAEPEKKGADE